MDLGDLTSPAAGARAPVLAVPVGSCEQHGPHLPLATDTIIATALCEALAARHADVVVAPAIGITSSGEHAGFPGTLSIGAAATELVLTEIVRSADWCGGVILVNGHGGNATAVHRATLVSHAEGRRCHAWWPPNLDGDAHAGRTETSLMLAIRPDLVRTDRLEVGDTRPLATIERDLVAHGVRAVSPSGVLGDPTAATLDEGNRLLRLFTDDLVTSVDHVLRTTWRPTTP